MMINVIAIVLSSLSLLVGIVILVFLLKKKDEGGSTENPRLERQLQQLQGSVFELKGALPSTIKNGVSEKMVDIQKTLGEAMEADNRRMSAFQATLSENMSKSIDVLNKKIDDNLAAINKRVDESLQNGFKGTSESMEKLQKALGEIDAAQKNIESLSGDVLSLKGILTNSQQRGRYGEMQLEMILSAMFGESCKGMLYDYQYTLQGGDDPLRPDAVVFLDGETKSQIIAIDAKFPIVGYEGLFGDASVEDKASMKAAFKAAVQEKVKQVCKYVDSKLVISPAILFIPNDGIFAYVQNEFPDLVNNAREKGVLLASPTILQPIIASFRIVQMDVKRTKNLEKINEALKGLGIEFERLSDRWEKIERSVGTLSKATGEFSVTVKKVDKKFGAISRSEIPEVEVEEPLPLEESENEN